MVAPIGSGDVQVMYLIKKISDSEITTTTPWGVFVCSYVK